MKTIQTDIKYTTEDLDTLLKMRSPLMYSNDAARFLLGPEK